MDLQPARRLATSPLGRPTQGGLRDPAREPQARQQSWPQMKLPRLQHVRGGAPRVTHHGRTTDRARRADYEAHQGPEIRGGSAQILQNALTTRSAADPLSMAPP